MFNDGSANTIRYCIDSGIEPSVHMIDPMHFDRIDHEDVVEKWYVYV